MLCFRLLVEVEDNFFLGFDSVSVVIVGFILKFDVVLNVV